MARKGSKEQNAARKAAALRDNLHRRKLQQRAAPTEATPPDDVKEPDTPETTEHQDEP